MKKISMIRAVKNSFFRIILFVIIVLIIIGMKNSLMGSFGGIIAIIVVATSGLFMMNAFIGIAASTLFNISYEAAIKKYGYKIIFFHGDKKSDGWIHPLRACCLSMIGMIIYPFALIMTIASFFEPKKDMAQYNAQMEDELKKIDDEEARDISIRTKDKKWMIKRGLSTNYYFNNKKEAIEYAIDNNLDMPTKI